MSEQECEVRNPVVFQENIREYEQLQARRIEELRFSNVQLRVHKNRLTKLSIESCGRKTPEIGVEKNFIDGMSRKIKRLEADISKTTRLIKEAAGKILQFTEMSMEQFFQEVVFQSVDAETYSKWRAEAVDRFRKAYRLEDEDVASA